MKKFSKLLLVILVVLIPLLGVDAKTKTTKKKTTTTTTTSAAVAKPVNFYIFYRSDCGVCAMLHEYTDTLEKDASINYMFNIVNYEIHNSANYQLMIKAGEYFEQNVDGVPFFVIGEKYFSGYNEQTSPDKIVETIKESYNKGAKDVVAELALNSGAEADKDEKDLTEEENKNDIVGYIILGITAAIIIAIIFGRSNTTYYEEIEVEEEEKTQEAPKTKTTKKTTNKSTKKK